MKYNSKNLGCGLRVRMAEQQISTTELSQKTGISRNTITAARSGDSKSIRLTTIEKICQVLNLTPNDLFQEPPKGW